MVCTLSLPDEMLKEDSLNDMLAAEAVDALGAILGVDSDSVKAHLLEGSTVVSVLKNALPILEPGHLDKAKTLRSQNE